MPQRPHTHAPTQHGGKGIPGSSTGLVDDQLVEHTLPGVEAANSVSSPRWRRGLRRVRVEVTTGTRRNPGERRCRGQGSNNRGRHTPYPRIRGWWSARKWEADRATTIRPFDLDAFRFRVRLFECRTGLGMTGEQQLAISFGGHEFVGRRVRRPQQTHPPADDSGARSHPRNHPATDRAETACPRPYSAATRSAHHARGHRRGPEPGRPRRPVSTPPTTVTRQPADHRGPGDHPSRRHRQSPTAGHATTTHTHAPTQHGGKVFGVEHPGLVDQRHQRISHSCTRTCGTDDAHSDRHRCSPRHTHAPSNTLLHPAGRGRITGALRHLPGHHIRQQPRPSDLRRRLHPRPARPNSGHRRHNPTAAACR